jgi:hypothetical protein
VGVSLAEEHPGRELKTTRTDGATDDTRGARRVAWLLDDVIRIPGTKLRIGIDPLLGLLPVGGDVAGGVLSGYIILAAARAGAPSAILLRMGVNVLIDAVVGTVPLLGDLFDAGWKANRRNALLLQQYVDKPAPVKRSSRAVVVLVLLVLALVLIGATALSIMLLRWLIGQF